MKKLAYLLIATVVLLTGCGGVEAVPAARDFDTSMWPTDVIWISPPKTWVGGYSPDEEVTFTLLLHSPASYSMVKVVSTTTAAEGEDGVLRQYFKLPVKDRKLSNVVEVISDHDGDHLKLEAYEVDTDVLVISGFEAVKMDRLVTITYIPSIFTYQLGRREPNSPDSCRELKNMVEFESMPQTANYYRFAESGTNRLTVTLPSSTTVMVDVLLKVPEGTTLPEYWWFWIGMADMTGKTVIRGVEVGVVHVYKVLVSDKEFRFIE